MSTRTRSAISPTPSPPRDHSTELSVQVEGEVDVQDTGGIVRGAIERFPPSLYLRATPLTEPDGAIADFARETRGHGRRYTAALHALLGRIHGEMIYDTDPTHSATTAAEAFALKRGVCQDLTHIFIAAARHLDIPARYVGGYFHRADGVTQQDAGHAWAEAYVPVGRLGRVRSDQWHLRDRCPCPGRGRAGLSRSGPGARRAPRRRRREHGRQGAGRSGRPAGAELTPISVTIGFAALQPPHPPPL